jgi:hypothetical protein
MTYWRLIMSSFKSAALLSLFSGVSLADLQRAYRLAEVSPMKGPALADIAYAVRFSGPAQVAVGDYAAAANDTTEREAA